MSFTIAEELLYSTVKINGYKNENLVSMGTGFIIGFTVSDDRNIFMLITNKHVLNKVAEVRVVFHISNNGYPSGKSVSCTIPKNKDFIIDHPSDDIDLCGIFLGPVIDWADKNNTPIFFRTIHPSLIPLEEDWVFFDAIEDVTMIGYPRGIFDEVNNLPIVRRGITASSLSNKYNGRPEFMVDMACFPGSSGSQIFLFDRTGYFDRRKNIYIMGASRLKLIGVLYAGPLVTNSGHLILGVAPRISVESMMHLGNALRSSVIVEIEKAARNRLSI